MAPPSRSSAGAPGPVTNALAPRHDRRTSTSRSGAPSSAAPSATAAQPLTTEQPSKRKPAPLQIISSSVRGAVVDRVPSIKRYSRYDSRRPSSVDSPTSVYTDNSRNSQVARPAFYPTFAPRDLDLYVARRPPTHISANTARNPHGATPSISPHGRSASLDSRLPPSQRASQIPLGPQGRKSSLRPPLLPTLSSSKRTTATYSASEYEDEPRTTQHSRSTTMTDFAPITPYAPNNSLTLQVDGTNPGKQLSTSEQASMSKGPKSPNKISSFFGWKSSPQPENASPTTTFSERSLSPPRSPNPDGAASADRRTSTSSVDNAANAYADYFSAPSPSSFMDASGAGTQVDELLKELREVSSELASSIRREMELEDEVDRHRNEIPTAPHELSRRTSDYYSDSGTSQMRYPLADSETKIEGLEKMRRKAEQEKAQLRAEMAQKVQDDIIHRKTLELHIQSLEEQVQARAPGQRTDRERELETSLEDTKRRLNEEKQFKENFEDLLAGMREEIEAHRNERDNLRDEVVPQLRARVEGLEADAGEVQKLTYENTRMQQELQNLKNENATLVNARKLQLDMQQGGRFKSIPEDEDSPPSPQLARSNSLARSRSLKARSGSISKANSPSQGHFDVTPQTIKDVEDQRDALHATLKSLLIRQDVQTKRTAKQIRALQKERDEAVSNRARRAGFNVEVRNLRSEVNALRQRADDAMEQKWQCEKGLSGLKMDLDRAKQETSSLRELLKEHDIFVPDTIMSPREQRTQESLEQAYEDLRVAHSDSMSRQRSGTVTSTRRPASLEAAEARMDALSQQVTQQLRSNNELRERLAEAIGRGEQEQEASAKKITELQNKLKSVEDLLMAAQQTSEDSMAEHEDHVKELKDSQIAQARRGISRSWTSLGLTAGSPKSPLFDAKSPKLGKTTTGAGLSVAEASKTLALEARVKDLEATAVQAEEEMQGVVERMNRAQIEVAELQAQRDEAMQQTRRLQRAIEEERVRAQAMGA